MKLYEKLINIQSKLKAPKGQYNSFGKYSYRSCEDIFEAVKPYLSKEQISLILSDDLVLIGDRYYVKATATLTDGEETITNVAYAREEDTKKGMDGSQITGASSSYARKYALNGLFLIDDVKDNDTTNTGSNTTSNTKAQTTKLEGSQRIALLNEINELELELDIPHEKTLEIYKVNSINQLTDSQLQKCVNQMKQVKEKGEK